MKRRFKKIRGGDVVELIRDFRHLDKGERGVVSSLGWGLPRGNVPRIEVHFKDDWTFWIHESSLVKVPDLELKIERALEGR